MTSASVYRPRSIRSIARVLLVAAATTAAGVTTAFALEPSFVTSDVERFYAVYDAAKGSPSADVLQRDYLDAGSDALHRFATSRHVTGTTLAAAIVKEAATFRDARACVGMLPNIRQRIADALRRLAVLVPAATFPPSRS